ncbi:hypothetical protein C8F01DRAFT_520638 [Mycena amicta]|nr:hypothetical protein C8F01DRAFT_520638 [Mycena amicta]
MNVTLVGASRVRAISVHAPRCCLLSSRQMSSPTPSTVSLQTQDFLDRVRWYLVEEDNQDFLSRLLAVSVDLQLTTFARYVLEGSPSSAQDVDEPPNPSADPTLDPAFDYLNLVQAQLVLVELGGTEYLVYDGTEPSFRPQVESTPPPPNPLAGPSNPPRHRAAIPPPFSFLPTSNESADDDMSGAAPVDASISHEATEYVTVEEWNEEDEIANRSVKLTIPPDVSGLTIHDLMVAPQEMNSTVAHSVSLSARPARNVEVATGIDEGTNLKEICFDFKLTEFIVNFSQQIDPSAADRIFTQPLEGEQITRLTSGFVVINGLLKTYREFDHQLKYCIGEGHFVSEANNILDGREDFDDGRRLFPRAGTSAQVVDRRTNKNYVAIPDVMLGESCKQTTEIKTERSITEAFIEDALRIDDHSLQAYGDSGRKCLLIKFQSPRGDGYDILGIHTQVLVQIWTQMCALGYSFAQASSHAWTLFAVRDPRHPNQMYISPCVQTFNTRSVDSPLASATDAQRVARRRSEAETLGPKIGLYVMMHLCRVANSEESTKAFLDQYPADADSRLVHVRYRNSANANVLPSKTLEAMPDTATVGVVYCIPPGQEHQTRGNVPESGYADISNSRVDEDQAEARDDSEEQPEAGPSKLQPSQANRPNTNNKGKGRALAKDEDTGELRKSERTAPRVGKGGRRPTTQQRKGSTPVPAQAAMPATNERHTSTTRSKLRDTKETQSTKLGWR